MVHDENAKMRNELDNAHRQIETLSAANNHLESDVNRLRDKLTSFDTNTKQMAAAIEHAKSEVL
jgi:FtsZ-binding cell division protein ZapB